MQEMPFQRPKFQNGVSNLYILLKSALKMQEMPFQRPKFQKISGGACPRTPLKLCRHFGLPLTKILATPLDEYSGCIWDARKEVVVSFLPVKGETLCVLRYTYANIFLNSEDVAR